MKIFVDENIPLLADSLKDCGDVEKFSGRNIKNSDLIGSNCEVLLVRSTTKVNQELLEGTNVKFVGTATAGIDHIDTGFLADQSISFADAKGSNANSVAEYVVWSLLKWAKNKNVNLQKTTIGIIGFGQVGSRVANYTHKLGLEVLVNDPPLLDSNYAFPDKYTYSSLEEIFTKADIITNHVPLTENGSHPTKNLINQALFSLIKQGALFIHASRGGVVDETPLIASIRNKGIISVIDVWQNEPNFNPELARMCMLATPHIAGYSKHGKVKGAMAMALAFEQFFSSKPDYSFFRYELADYSPLSLEHYKNPDYILETLSGTRLFDNDGQLFLEISHLPEAEKIKAFDRLRKQYPPRRESL